MILGICEVNDRHYCVGVWTTYAHLVADMQGKATVEDMPITQEERDDPLSPAYARTAAMRYGVDLHEEWLRGDTQGVQWGTNWDCFTAYEFHGTFPGLVGFDED